MGNPALQPHGGYFVGSPPSLSRGFGMDLRGLGTPIWVSQGGGGIFVPAHPFACIMAPVVCTLHIFYSRLFFKNINFFTTK